MANDVPIYFILRQDAKSELLKERLLSTLGLFARDRTGASNSAGNGRFPMRHLAGLSILCGQFIPQNLLAADLVDDGL